MPGPDPDTASTPLRRAAPRARIMSEIQKWIADGTLRRGDSLPSEVDLAERLQATRSTVHLAIKDLERDGVIVALPGRGRVVADATTRRSLMADTIAMLTSEFSRERNPSQPGWAQHTQYGALDAIADAGLHALCLQPRALAGERLGRLLLDPPRGVVALAGMIEPVTRWQAIAACRKAGLAVAVDEDEPETVGCDIAESDQAAGCAMLTSWLFARGCRKILRVWNIAREPARRPAWLEGRDRGFALAHAEAGVAAVPPIDLRMPNMGFGGDEDFRLTASLLAGLLAEQLRGANRPDALMAASDGNAYALAAACRLLGLEPNRDIAIVGYDNYWADTVDRRHIDFTPLATVDKRNARVGRELVRLVEDRIGGRLAPGPAHVRLAPELIVIPR